MAFGQSRPRALEEPVKEVAGTLVLDRGDVITVLEDLDQTRD